MQKAHGSNKLSCFTNSNFHFLLDGEMKLRHMCYFHLVMESEMKLILLHKGLFIYVVSTGLGGWVQKLVIFAY